MTTPFQASKLFNNNAGNNGDGWDDWDWNDSSNTSNNATPQHQQQHQHQQQPPFMDHTQSYNQSNQTNAYVPPVSNFYQPQQQHQQKQQALPPTLNNNMMQNKSHYNIVDNNNVNSAGSHQDNYSTQNWFQQQPYSQQTIANNNNNSMQNQVLHTPPPAFQSVPNIDNEFNEYRQIESPGEQTAVPENLMSENRPLNTGFPTPPPAVPVYKGNAQQVLSPPSLDQSPYLNTNPFKRVGSHAHRTPPPLTATPPAMPVPTIPEQQPQQLNQQQYSINSFINQQTASHLPDSGSVVNYQAVENNELAPHNDRNEYLQTGHLSEEGSAQEIYITDNLPPPGLSRLVLGQPETVQNVQAQSPSPALERQIPGTELNYSSNLNLERQADGQDTDESNRPAMQYSSQPPLSSSVVSPNLQIESNVYIPTGSETHTGRNNYHVAGESNSVNAAQRVITGDENVENQEVPIAEQQRELEMDGENIEDNLQSNRRQIQSSSVREREEPIEGANVQDDIVPSSSHATTSNQNITQSDSVEDLDTNNTFHQKYQSNASTGNDESDKEKSYSSRKNTSYRRNEERSKKKDDKRYETEDTDYDRRDRRRTRDAPRDKFERNDNGYESNREKDRGRKQIDKTDRNYRDRPSGRDKHNRDSSRDDEDRYDRRYRDRGNRYDTDASRYETEDSRNEHENRRRGEKDHGRYRDDRTKKNYERERGRNDRDKNNRDKNDRDRNDRDDRRQGKYSVNIHSY